MLGSGPWPPQPEGISVLSGHPVLCFATQETSAASETAEGPAQRRGGRGEATVEWEVNIKRHSKGERELRAGQCAPPKSAVKGG